MRKAPFFIEGRAYAAHHARDDAFDVQSVPRPYAVTWSRSESPAETVRRLLQNRSDALVMMDRKVMALHGRGMGLPTGRVLAAPATERFKTLAGVLKAIAFLDAHHATKAGSLVVAGGGILQDVGAFASACYKRGIPWIYVPTTLLAMADSCIGGKCGINHRGIKNQLALFSAPREVHINPGFLHTLEPGAMRSGLGEIAKLHLIGGPLFWEAFADLCPRGKVECPEDGRKLILNALAVKRAVVERDEFELDHRRALNFGHTFGHALESLSGFRIAHGQAVVAGMLIANEFSRRRGWLRGREGREIRERLLTLLTPSEKGILRNLPIRDLGRLLRMDKKSVGGAITLVLLEAVGKTRFIRQTPDPDFFSAVGEILRTLD